MAKKRVKLRKSDVPSSLILVVISFAFVCTMLKKSLFSDVAGAGKV